MNLRKREQRGNITPVTDDNSSHRSFVRTKTVTDLSSDAAANSDRLHLVKMYVPSDFLFTQGVFQTCFKSFPNALVELFLLNCGPRFSVRLYDRESNGEYADRIGSG